MASNNRIKEEEELDRMLEELGGIQKHDNKRMSFGQKKLVAGIWARMDADIDIAGPEQLGEGSNDNEKEEPDGQPEQIQPPKYLPGLGDTEAILSEEENYPCPICGQCFSIGQIEDHASRCDLGDFADVSRVPRPLQTRALSEADEDYNQAAQKERVMTQVEKDLDRTIEEELSKLFEHGSLNDKIRLVGVLKELNDKEPAMDETESSCGPCPICGNVYPLAEITNHVSHCDNFPGVAEETVLKPSPRQTRSATAAAAKRKPKY